MKHDKKKIQEVVHFGFFDCELGVKFAATRNILNITDHLLLSHISVSRQKIPLTILTNN